MNDVDECAAIAVDLGLKIHRDLGPGMLESVYESILAGQLQRAGLAVERQRPIAIEYEGIVYHEGFALTCWSKAASSSRSSRSISWLRCTGANC